MVFTSSIEGFHRFLGVHFHLKASLDCGKNLRVMDNFILLTFLHNWFFRDFEFLLMPRVKFQIKLTLSTRIFNLIGLKFIFLRYGKSAWATLCSFWRWSINWLHFSWNPADTTGYFRRFLVSSNIGYSSLDSWRGRQNLFAGAT